MSTTSYSFLERAAFALGQLHEVNRRSPIYRGLHWRECILGAAHHAALDNAAINPIHLIALLNGLRLNKRQFIKDYGHLQKAIVRFDLLYIEKDTSYGDLPSRELLWDRDDVIDHFFNTGKTGLLDTAQFLWDIMKDGIKGQSIGLESIRAAVPYMLQVNVENPPFLPICGAKAFSLETNQFNYWRKLWLSAIRKEVSGILTRQNRLYRNWYNARTNLPGIRKSDTIYRSIDALALAGLISPTRLKDTLGVSLKRAGNILEELVTLDVAVEVTKRRTHKLYGFREFDEIILETTGPITKWKRGRPFIPPEPNKPKLESDLTPLPKHKNDDIALLLTMMDTANNRASSILKAYEINCKNEPQ